MKAGEELSIHEVEKLDLGEDFKLALSRALGGANVYIVGPPGSGKTAMLRKLGLYLSRSGRGAAYVKLEWAKYGWGLGDYLKHYGARNIGLIGAEASGDVVLLDDGELLWSYSSAYRNLVRDVRQRQVVAAFREIDMDTLTILFGDGFTIYLQRQTAARPAVKAPLGLGFIGRTSEIVVI
jgi:hypothetical protein